MLTALDSAPQALLRRGAVAAVPVRPRWLGRPPATATRGEPVRLAPGVWIVRERHWIGAAALDTAAELPDYPDREPPTTRKPRYSPPAWHRRGLCSKLPLSLSDPLFFGSDSNVPPEGLILAVTVARRLCENCPVARTCLTDALVNDHRYGVRGGTSGRERGKMRLALAAGATVAQVVDQCLQG